MHKMDGMLKTYSDMKWLSDWISKAKYRINKICEGAVISGLTTHCHTIPDRVQRLILGPHESTKINSWTTWNSLYCLLMIQRCEQTMKIQGIHLHWCRNEDKKVEFCMSGCTTLTQEQYGMCGSGVQHCLLNMYKDGVNFFQVIVMYLQVLESNQNQKLVQCAW